MLKVSLIFFCATAMLCTQVYAQDLPKFDGVYLGFKDGTFEKLSPFSGQQIIVDNYGATQEATPQFYVPVIIDGVALQPDIQSATYFDSASVESIFIRSRTTRLNFIENVVNLRDLYLRNYGLENDPVRRAAYLERLDRDYSGVAGTGCGIEAVTMNLLNESETTYQYFFEGSKLLDQNGADIQMFFAKKEGCFIGGAGDASKSLGLLLSTNSGKFLLLETDAMRNHYPSSNLSGRADLVEGTNDIEDLNEDVSEDDPQKTVYIGRADGQVKLSSQYWTEVDSPRGKCVFWLEGSVLWEFTKVPGRLLLKLKYGEGLYTLRTLKVGESWNGVPCK